MTIDVLYSQEALDGRLHKHVPTADVHGNSTRLTQVYVDTRRILACAVHCQASAEASQTSYGRTVMASGGRFLWYGFRDRRSKCAQPVQEMLVASLHPMYAANPAGPIRAHGRDHERRASTQIWNL